MGGAKLMTMYTFSKKKVKGGIPTIIYDRYIFAKKRGFSCFSACICAANLFRCGEFRGMDYTLFNYVGNKWMEHRPKPLISSLPPPNDNLHQFFVISLV